VTIVEKKTWKECISDEMHKLNLRRREDAQDRGLW
jgi:hypothetical protein